jgi:hypothetical protein
MQTKRVNEDVYYQLHLYQYATKVHVELRLS